MRFRRRPVEIDAFKWTGGPDQTEDPIWIIEAIKGGHVSFVDAGHAGVSMTIQTLEGTMVAQPGDWIIRSIEGELYPCKPDVFAAIYEPIDPPQND